MQDGGGRSGQPDDAGQRRRARPAGSCRRNPAPSRAAPGPRRSLATLPTTRPFTRSICRARLARSSPRFICRLSADRDRKTILLACALGPPWTMAMKERSSPVGTLIAICRDRRPGTNSAGLPPPPCPASAISTILNGLIDRSTSSNTAFERSMATGSLIPRTAIVARRLRKGCHVGRAHRSGRNAEPAGNDPVFRACARRGPCRDGCQAARENAASPTACSPSLRSPDMQRVSPSASEAMIAPRPGLDAPAILARQRRGGTGRWQLHHRGRMLCPQAGTSRRRPCRTDRDQANRLRWPALRRARTPSSGEAVTPVRQSNPFRRLLGRGDRPCRQARRHPCVPGRDLRAGP